MEKHSFEHRVTLRVTVRVTVCVTVCWPCVVRPGAGLRLTVPVRPLRLLQLTGVTGSDGTPSHSFLCVHCNVLIRDNISALREKFQVGLC